MLHARPASSRALWTALFLLLAASATAGDLGTIGVRRVADPGQQPFLPGYDGSRLVDPGLADPGPEIPVDDGDLRLNNHNTNANGKRAAYFRCNSRPWGLTSNETSMDAVFGPGNWDTVTYESNNTTPFTGTGYDVIFMEGGDQCASELETYLNNNRAAIESWTAACHGLLLQAAPNEDNGMLFWSDGTTLIYPDFNGCGNSNAVNATHPIYVGPNPTVSAQTGSCWAHGILVGGGATALTRDGAGRVVVSEKVAGSGRVIFSAGTLSFFHNPQPQGDNLYRNMLHYLDELTTLCGQGGGCDLTGVEADLAAIEAKLDDATRFTSDADRNSQTTTLVGEINQNETGIARLEAKLDDGARWTSDAENGAQTTTLVGEINQNETAIGRLEVKLDDATRYTSDAENNAQTTTLVTEINQNETAIARLEAKMDDGTRWTSDAENNAQTTTLVTEINQNETAIGRLEVKLDDATRYTSDAENSAQTVTIVGEINQNETGISRLESKLDDETRFADDAELNAVHADLDGDIAAIESKMDEHMADTSDLLNLQIRIEVEHALGEDTNDNRPMAIFMLPASVGGKLELCRDVADDTINRVEAAGCSSNGARDEWTLGNDDYAAQKWDAAYAHYANAYKSSTMGPCN